MNASFPRGVRMNGTYSHAMVALILAAALLLSPEAAAGQRARRAPGAPSELVRALAQGGVIGMFSNDSVSVVEGGIPARWAAVLPVPPAARVLGTVFGATAASAYLVVRGTPEQAATLVESMAGPKGWKPFRPYPPPGPPFVGQSLAHGPAQYCRGPHEQLMVAPRAWGGSTLVEMIYMSGNGSVCDSEHGPTRLTDVLPALEAPPLAEGARPMDCYGPGVGLRSSGTSTRLVTDASPAAILAGYGRQLEAAGWRPVEASVPPAVGAWSKSGKDSGTDQVLLVVTPEAGTRRACRSVSMTLERRP